MEKMRTVVIRDEAIVRGAKHPEDDHHMQCQPFPENGKIFYRQIILAAWSLGLKLRLPVCLN